MVAKHKTKSLGNKVSTAKGDINRMENTLLACGASTHCYGTQTESTSFAPIILQDTHRIKRISISNALGHHFVFLAHSIDGNTELYGVGENNYGELATKTTNVYKQFTKLPTEFLSRVKQVSCSYFDTSVLLEDGKIFSTGQIYGSGFKRVNVDDNANIAHLYSSTYNLFGVTDEGEVYMCRPHQKTMQKLSRKHQGRVLAFVPGGYHIAYKIQEQWIVQVLDYESGRTATCKKLKLPENEIITHVACGWASVYAATGNVFRRMYNNPTAITKLIWNHLNIRKLVACMDFVIVLTNDGKLWSNGKGDPKVHFSPPNDPEADKFYELDISSQLNECLPGTYIENFVSSSEGFFLLFGPNPCKELDLMKIWQKEAFVDIVVM